MNEKLDGLAWGVLAIYAMTLIEVKTGFEEVDQSTGARLRSERQAYSR